MLKSILTTDRDLKETAIIEKRRRAEEDRRKRFFDEKQRVLGIDLEGLNYQLSEKKQREEFEKEQARLEAEEMQKNLEIAKAREVEHLEQKRKSEIEINEFRKNCQQTQDCSDFDLFDPNGNKKSLPARLDDNDPRLSISGGQLFIGEDIANANRVREQKFLQKQWLDQQIAQKNAFKSSQKEAEKKMSASLQQHDMSAVFFGNKLNDDKREIQRQIREYNQSLAQQKRDNDKKRREIEQQDSMAEIYNFLSSDLLKENQPKGSNLGPNRTIVTMYKGMTPEQIDAHKLEQEKQLNDIKMRRMEEESQKRQWENLTEDTYRQMTLKERALSRSIRNMNHQIRQENEELAKEQKEKIEHYERVVNTNSPSDEFFDQFSTSAR